MKTLEETLKREHLVQASYFTDEETGAQGGLRTRTQISDPTTSYFAFPITPHPASLLSWDQPELDTGF